MSEDYLDGRDALVKEHFKNRKDLIPTIQTAESHVSQYHDPWGPSPYSRFDDFMPIRLGTHVPIVDHEKLVRCEHWSLPVTMVDRHEGAAAYYEQWSAGSLEITQTPRPDGTFEIKLGIAEP